jgi:hypothetical protein
MTFVRKTPDERRVSFFKSFEVNKTNELIVTSKKLKSNF